MISIGRRRVRRCAPLLVLLLAACAAPVKHPLEIAQPVKAAQTSIAEKPSPKHVVSPPEAPTMPAAADVWQRLRASFQMDDCSSDPAVLLWAKRFTASPAGFQHSMERALPRLTFIQSIAQKHAVAGEFVLLPWVESRYRPVHGQGRQPGGMWQIVPRTAGSLGLRVTRGFDGRMDIATSTEAVMSMLELYQEQFHDWRVTDYAYNAGEYSIRRLVARHGMPPADPVIPTLPVRNVTREHLIKLLAIACVVRSPERFNVSLPHLPTEQRLVAVPVTRPMSMRQAARHAGMSEDTLKRYNSAFINNRIDPELSDQLLLPGSQAEQFRQFVAQGASEPMDEQGVSAVTEVAKKTRKHTVRSGESLWSIARHYAVSVKQLRLWNQLRDSIVKPGQVLSLIAP